MRFIYFAKKNTCYNVIIKKTEVLTSTLDYEGMHTVLKYKRMFSTWNIVIKCSQRDTLQQPEASCNLLKSLRVGFFQSTYS